MRAADAAVVAVDVRGAQLLSLLQALLNAPPHGLQVNGRIRADHSKGKGFRNKGMGYRNKGMGFRNKGIRAKGLAAGEGGGSGLAAPIPVPVGAWRL